MGIHVTSRTAGLVQPSEKETKMRPTLAIAALAAVVLATPAFSEEMMKCDEASMMKMKTDMDSMSGMMKEDQKQMAMKEMDMAKEAMAANKMDECSMHMEKASKEMMK